MDGDHRVTLTDEAMGSRDYIAPEMEAGQRQPVTGAADVYALGKVLYYMAQRTADEGDLEHVGQLHVVHVGSAPEEQDGVFDAPHGRSHQPTGGLAGDAPIARSPGRGGEDGGHDVLIAGAAADVSPDRLAYFGRGRCRVLAEQAMADHQHPGGAEAALEALMFPERALERAEPSLLGEALDRPDL